MDKHIPYPSTIDPCSNNNNNTNNKKIYKGVRKRKWGKWVSEIRLPNSRERIWLGSYDTQVKAARAFDAALYCLRGRHASFNFPQTPLSINVSSAGKHSFSPQEIQEIAAKFANESPMELNQEEGEVRPSQESQIGVNSSNSSVMEKTTTNSSSSSSSDYLACPPYDNDGATQVGYGDQLRTMDWTFSDMLDEMNIGVACSDFGELIYPTQHYEDNNGDQIEGQEDSFSNHSFLWSWNF